MFEIIQGQVQLSEQNFIEFFYFRVKKQREMFKFSIFVGHQTSTNYKKLGFLLKNENQVKIKKKFDQKIALL